jgi:CubicO group peptidase (beta-lactamase class C family)
MIPALRGALEQGVARGLAPGAVAAAADLRGATALCAAGRLSVDSPEPMRPDAMFRLYSMTKLVGAVCAAMLWEDGSLDLDAPAARYAPQFADLPVLEGWDGDRPRLAPQRRAATVRQLATHTSGSVYAMWSPDLRRHQALTGARPAARGCSPSRWRSSRAPPGATARGSTGWDWSSRP